MKTMIKNGYVVSVDPKIGEVKNCDILIEDGIIKEVGCNLVCPDASVIDAKDHIVMPGFVDNHRHNWQSQLRTVASEWTLFDYMANMRSVYSSMYTPEDAYIGNYLGAVESLNAGITTMVDHCHLINSPEHSDKLVDGLVDSGIRGVFCYGFFVNPKYHPYRKESEAGWRYEDAARIKTERFKDENALVSFGVNPSEVAITPFDIVKKELELSRAMGAKIISCHAATGFYDFGGQIVAKLYKAGLLGNDMIFVHGASFTDEELDMIKVCDAAVIATPETELQMGMGKPVAFRCLDRGVKTSVGLDIISNCSAEMFTQMRLLLQCQRADENEEFAGKYGKAPGRVRRSTRDVLYLATQGGADSINIGDVIGSITPGKRADIIMIKTDELNMAPVVNNPIGSIIYYANASNIDTVMVNGELKKFKGKLVNVDVPNLIEKVVDSRKRLDQEFALVDPNFNDRLWKDIYKDIVHFD